MNAPSETARLLCRTGELAGATYEVGPEATLGRRSENDIVLGASAISGRHARIYLENGEYHVEDLDSSNGTQVDGMEVTGPTPLGRLHVITLADAVDLVFVRSDAAQHAEADAPASAEPAAAAGAGAGAGAGAAAGSEPAADTGAAADAADEGPHTRVQEFAQPVVDPRAAAEPAGSGPADGAGRADDAEPAEEGLTRAEGFEALPDPRQASEPAAAEGPEPAASRSEEEGLTRAEGFEALPDPREAAAGGAPAEPEEPEEPEEGRAAEAEEQGLTRAEGFEALPDPREASEPGPASAAAPAEEPDAGEEPEAADATQLTPGLEPVADPRAEAEESAPAERQRALELAVALPDQGLKTFALKEGENTIGRSEGCDVRVVDPHISRKHALLRLAADGVELVDLNSSNGTFVDGEQIETVPIEPGQSFRLGPDLEFTVLQK